MKQYIGTDLANYQSFDNSLLEPVHPSSQKRLRPNMSLYADERVGNRFFSQFFFSLKCSCPLYLATLVSSYDCHWINRGYDTSCSLFCITRKSYFNKKTLIVGQNLSKKRHNMTSSELFKAVDDDDCFLLS